MIIGNGIFLRGAPYVNLGAYSPEVQQFFDRAVELTDPFDINIYSTVINNLVDANIWAIADRIVPFALAPTLTTVVRCLKSPVLCDLINDPNFDAYRGLSGDLSAYINTNYNPLQDGVHFQQDSACVALWQFLDRGDNGHATLGAQSPTGSNVAVYCYTAGQTVAAVNDNFNAGVTGVDATGLFCGNRSSSASRETYRNGVSLGTYPAGPSMAPPDLDIYILGTNVNGTVTAQIGDQAGLFGAFGDMDAGLQADFYSIFQTAFSAVGVV